MLPLLDLHTFAAKPAHLAAGLVVVVIVSYLRRSRFRFLRESMSMYGHRMKAKTVENIFPVFPVFKGCIERRQIINVRNFTYHRRILLIRFPVKVFVFNVYRPPRLSIPFHSVGTLALVGILGRSKWGAMPAIKPRRLLISIH